MPRNLSGVYTLPAGNPVVPGTTIDASWANTTLEDISNELTNSLSRTGAGGMLAPFRIADGNVTGPGLSFLNETNTGYFRVGAGSTAFAVLGVNTLQINTTAVTVPNTRTLNAQGAALVGGTLGVTGAATFASTLAATGAITATGGVLGNITAASGTSTFNDLVINGSLDMVAGSSATITGLSTPINASDAANKGYVDTQDALKLNLSGGTMSGNIAMGNNLVTGLGTPVSGGDATNKTYVDGQIATRLALAGGTMSGAIAMGTNKITGLGTPTADADAATKAYVDSVAQGLDVKGSVRAATTGNITLSGTQTIDGVAVIAGDRVLVKDQSTAANNGIYVAAAGSWSRAADANTWDELVGAFVFVEDGTVSDNSGWVCTVTPGGTLGVTAVTFEQFSGAGQITAGAGMVKVGNTLNVQSASSSRIVVGADEIDLATTGVGAGTYRSVTVDTYGRVTAGTNPTTLAGYGITDAYTSTATDTLLAGKLSLTGGTMSGPIAMGTSKITGLGDPTNAQDAATKNYTDTGLNAKLSLSGGTMTGALAMGTNRITGMGDPVNAQDGATKNYIDTIFGSTTSAAASAAAAAASATAAQNSANSASSSASSASSSASTASTALFNFRAQYLGPLASDPTVDGNGNPVTAGDLYFNTVANETRVYNGTAWVAAYVPAAIYAQLAAANVFTANQTITANTSSDALKITQTGSGNALYIEDVAADATPFVVSSTGVLGIGTTTPDNVTSAGIALVSNSGFYPQLIQRNTANDANASYLGLEKIRGSSVVQNGDILGNIVFRGYDGTQFLQGAAIWSQVAAAPGANDMPADLVFGTTPDGAAGISERLRITQSGAGTATQDWTFQGVRVGRGAGAVSTNTAVGASALAANTTGERITAVGNNALLSNTTGNYAVAVGWEALRSNTIGDRNHAFGYASMYTNTTGNYNTAVGYGGLYANTTGGNNSAIGYSVLGANTTGSNNTAVGTDSLYFNTTASNNTAVGYQAGYSNTTGAFNAALGGAALYSNTTASYNTAVGYQAAYANTTGTRNAAFASFSLLSNTTGNYNTALGYETLGANTTGSNNTAIGYQALDVNTTASNNTAVGYQAGYSNTTGASNTAVGYQALLNNTTVSGNTAVGFQSLYVNSTGVENTAVGGMALYANTTGSYNTAFGGNSGSGIQWYAALRFNTTGSHNAAFGDGALAANTTGSQNTACGTASLYGNTTASNNTAVGYQAGYGITTGAENTFLGYNAGNSGNGSGIIGIGYQAGRGGCTNSVWVGYNAGQSTSNSGTYNVGMGFYAGVSNTSGGSNVFIGYSAGSSNTTGGNNVFVGGEAGNGTGAGSSNTTGSQNTAVGASALKSNTTATDNAAFGYRALFANTTGTQNTSIGRNAGGSITTGSYNTCVGYDSGTTLSTGAYNTLIGFTTATSAAGGNYQIVISADNNQATGKGDSTGFIQPNDGGVYQGNNSSSWSTTSDRRLKKNIVDNNEGIDVISQIRVRNFEYRLPEEITEVDPKFAIRKPGVQLGPIAQELQEVCPNCVTEESTGVLGVDSDEIFWHMVNAIKQLKTELDSVKAELATLKGNSNV